MQFRVHIDGDWSARQFGKFFEELSEVSNWFSADWLTDSKGEYIADSRGWPLSVETQHYELTVDRISFGSPGFIDLAGIGKAFEQLRLFLEFLIERSDRRNSVKLEEEERRLDIEAQRLRLAQEYSQIVEKDPKILQLLQSSGGTSLIEAALDSRIRRIEMLEDK